MAEHDQRFKVLLQEFLREFLLLFFPDLVEQLDLTQVEWLHQEIYPDPPHGKLLTIDLIARIPRKSSSPAAEGEPAVQTILLHLEFEADDKVEPFRRRFYDYFHFLISKHGPVVLPIAVYLRVGLQGQGKDHYLIEVMGRKVLDFEYDYVGLPGLAGEPFLAGDNPLGVALSALMRWPREQQAQKAVEALERIVDGPETPGRKHLLCECVQAYALLEDDQRIELNSLLEQPQRAGVRQMAKTWTEEGREQGREQGLVEGQRLILLDLLEAKFPPLGEAIRQRVAQLPGDKVRQLARAVLTAESLDALGLKS
jgi:hypothetical protein